MKKDLPRVYANPIDKELRNNTDVYYGKNDEVRSDQKVNVYEKINQIFASPHHVYKSNVLIQTRNGEIKTTIVGKSGNYLLSLNGDKINMLDIVDIKRIWTFVCSNLTNRENCGRILITSQNLGGSI